MRIFFFIILVLFSISCFAQDDLLDMLKEESIANNNSIIFATWKTMKLVNIHSTEIVKRNALDFRVTSFTINAGLSTDTSVHTFVSALSDSVKSAKYISTYTPYDATYKHPYIDVG